MILYGFPPGVGATGTAALLNVPKSLERLLATLRQVGGLLVRRAAGWRASAAARRAPLHSHDDSARSCRLAVVLRLATPASF